MNEARELRRQKQRGAIWKWEWLGLRDSTLAFKLSLLIIGVAAVGAAIRLFA